MSIVAVAVIVLAILIGAFVIRGALKAMSEALDRIRREVAETRSATASALALITGLAGQIREKAEDPVALNALADSLDEGQAEIAAAVTANTPAEPVAEEESPPEGGGDQG